MSPTVAGTPAKSKAKVAKEPKTKKAAVTAPKKVRSYPPYSEMINEAIVSLKERTGSSQIAIAKFIEEKQKDLPVNFKKLLFVQLKKLVVNGKLVKVKNSFKLPPKTASVSVAKAPAAVAAAKPKAKTEATGKKKATELKKKKTVTKEVKTTTAKAPVKKKTVKSAAAVKTPVKKAAVAKKKTPVKGAKKPKSIKSPVKKARVTRANK